MLNDRLERDKHSPTTHCTNSKRQAETGRALREDVEFAEREASVAEREEEMAVRLGQSGPEELEVLAGKTRDCGVVLRWEDGTAGGESDTMSSEHELLCPPGLEQKHSAQRHSRDTCSAFVLQPPTQV